jgi:hypothetical protein
MLQGAFASASWLLAVPRQEATALKKSLPTKILNIPTGRLLNHFHRELQQTNFPTLVDAMDDGAGAPQRLRHLARDAVQNGFDRIMDQTFREIVFPDLKSIFQQGGVSCLQHFGKPLRLLSEAFEGQFRDIFGRQYLGAIRLDPSVANADFIRAVHQLGDEIEMEAGGTEGLDSTFR